MANRTKKIKTTKEQYVAVIPLPKTMTYRVIGLFDSIPSAHKWVEEYFQDDPEYTVEPYNKKQHNKLLETTQELDLS